MRIKTYIFLLFILISATSEAKELVVFDVPESISRYTQHLTLDVDDVPDHQLRIFELESDFGNAGPLVDGEKIRKIVGRSTTDYIDLSGHAMGYLTIEMDNGDKIFARSNHVAHRVGPDESRGMRVAVITGGTGKFMGIRGIVKSEAIASPYHPANKKYKSTKYEIEYWIVK